MLHHYPILDNFVVDLSNVTGLPISSLFFMNMSRKGLSSEQGLLTCATVEFIQHFGVFLYYMGSGSDGFNCQNIPKLARLQK